MGGCFSGLCGCFLGALEVRILMLGLDNAGKTSISAATEPPLSVAILYKLKMDETVTTIPTVGFNVESIMRRNVKLNMWDVGGQDKIRPLWRHYYAGTTALIYVIDASDQDRIEEARVELHRVVLDRELKECALLIYANKQDLSGCMSTGELADALQIDQLAGRRWHIQPSCATTGDGLPEGLDWLVSAVQHGGRH